METRTAQPSAYDPGQGLLLFAAANCREAAAILQHLADNATKGAWGVGNGDNVAVDVEQTSRGSYTSGWPVAEMSGERWRYGGKGEPEIIDNPSDAIDDAAYIALVQPSVGKALAALLEAVGNRALAEAVMPAPEVQAVAQAVLAVKYPLARQTRYDLPDLEEV